MVSKLRVVRATLRQRAGKEHGLAILYAMNENQQTSANIPGPHILPTCMWKDPLKLLSVTLNGFSFFYTEMLTILNKHVVTQESTTLPTPSRHGDGMWCAAQHM